MDSYEYVKSFIVEPEPGMTCYLFRSYSYLAIALALFRYSVKKSTFVLDSYFKVITKKEVYEER